MRLDGWRGRDGAEQGHEDLFGKPINDEHGSQAHRLKWLRMGGSHDRRWVRRGNHAGCDCGRMYNKERA